MKGIPKGLCSFGGVTPHKMGRCREATEGTYLLGQRRRLWWGVGQSPAVTKALRKGEFQKQSSGLFLKEGRLASEGVP